MLLCLRHFVSAIVPHQTYSICFRFWLLNVEEVEARAWLILDFEQVMLFKLNVPLPEDPFADAEPWQTNQDKGGNFHLSNSEPSWGFYASNGPNSRFLYVSTSLMFWSRCFLLQLSLHCWQGTWLEDGKSSESRLGLRGVRKHSSTSKSDCTLLPGPKPCARGAPYASDKTW